MGHIQQRPGRVKKWKARYRAPDGSEPSKSFERKVDAEKWLATQTADVARGAWVDPSLGRMKFAEWATKWQAGLHDLKPRTLDLNLGVLKTHLLPRFGKYQIAHITTSDVKEMVSEAVADGVSGSSVRRRVFVLSNILGAAVADSRLARNVCEGVKLPPESARPMRFLTPDLVLNLAGTFREHYQPLIYTAAYVGLRWGELAGLGVEQVDVLRRKIVVSRALIERNQGPLIFGPPKSKAGVRSVSIPAAIADMLGEHMGTEAVQTSGLVFPNLSGQLMRRSNFRKTWLKTVGNPKLAERMTAELREQGMPEAEITERVQRKTSGLFTGTHLEGLVFHELRHTAAALAIGEGAHPLTIKERLGHSSIKVTMDTYGHLFPAQDEALAEALDGVLRKSMSDKAAAQMRPTAAPVVSLRRSEG